MSHALEDHATSEGKIAFVRYTDEPANATKTVARVFLDAHRLGYEAALTPRSIVEIEADAASLLASEFGMPI